MTAFQQRLIVPVQEPAACGMRIGHGFLRDMSFKVEKLHGNRLYIEHHDSSGTSRVRIDSLLFIKALLDFQQKYFVADEFIVDNMTIDSTSRTAFALPNWKFKMNRVALRGNTQTIGLFANDTSRGGKDDLMYILHK